MPKHKKKRVVEVDLYEGDWLEVMDTEGTWNVARVVSIPSRAEIEVSYDGWGNQYNEVVPLNSERVAPYHTYTWTVRCWAKQPDGPFAPAVVHVRSPGTNHGVTYLTEETRMFVDFMDNPRFSKRRRVWIEVDEIVAFKDMDKYSKNNNGVDFSATLERVQQTDASDDFPTLVKGSLPSKFAIKCAESALRLRKLKGAEAWIQAFVDGTRLASESRKDQSTPRNQTEPPSTKQEIAQGDQRPLKRRNRGTDNAFKAEKAVGSE